MKKESDVLEFRCVQISATDKSYVALLQLAFSLGFTWDDKTHSIPARNNTLYCFTNVANTTGVSPTISLVNYRDPNYDLIGYNPKDEFDVYKALYHVACLSPLELEIKKIRREINGK